MLPKIFGPQILWISSTCAAAVITSRIHYADQTKTISCTCCVWYETLLRFHRSVRHCTAQKLSHKLIQLPFLDATLSKLHWGYIFHGCAQNEFKYSNRYRFIKLCLINQFFLPNCQIIEHRTNPCVQQICLFESHDTHRMSLPCATCE